MNKLIKSAMMMASVGAMLCIVGCGNEGNGNVGGGNTPESVAIESLKAELKDMGGEAASCTLKVSKSEIDGTKGIVYVDVFSGGKKEITSEVNVYKDGNIWRVGKTQDDQDLDAAACAAQEIAFAAREKLGRPEYKDNWKPGDPMNVFENKVAAREKKGDSVYVTIESFANDKKYDSFVIEMKKTGEKWVPVYKK